MNLKKWRCGTCGFEWFEPIQFRRADRNLEHGCPQGCDDAGKALDTVEAINGKGEWISWVLNKEKINSVAKTVGLKTGNLAESDYEYVVKNSTKALLSTKEEWNWILKEAVEKVVG